MLTNELLLRLLWATRELCIIYESVSDEVARREILGGVKTALEGTPQPATPAIVFADILNNFQIDTRDWVTQESIFSAIQISLENLLADSLD